MKYWRKYDDTEPGANRIFVPATMNQTRLENMLPDAHYLIEVRAYNGAGFGPPSEHCEMFTRRPRETTFLNTQDCRTTLGHAGTFPSVVPGRLLAVKNTTTIPDNRLVV